MRDDDADETSINPMSRPDCVSLPIQLGTAPWVPDLTDFGGIEVALAPCDLLAQIPCGDKVLLTPAEILANRNDLAIGLQHDHPDAGAGDSPAGNEMAGMMACVTGLADRGANWAECPPPSI